MPRGDRTGPAGQGPMTGRGLGYCAGYNSPGFTRGYGMGMGWGGGRRGYGYGYGRGYFGPNYAYPPPVQQQTEPEQEISALKAQAGALQNQLKNILDRLESLTGKKEE